MASDNLETTPPTTPPQALPRLNTNLGFRLLLGLFAAALLIYSAVTIANAFIPGKSIKDYELWYATGQQVLHGDAIYPPPHHKFPFMYPPAAALFLAPVALLGKSGLVIALVLVNAVAWTACILLSTRIATGEGKRAHLLLYLIPSAVIAVYAWSNFHLGQPTLVLLALMLGGFCALQRKRVIPAGALFAIAAAIKAFPFVALVYLIYRRYWTAAAAMLATLLFLLLALPAPFRGWQQTRADLQRWTEGMLLKYDDTGVAQRPGRSNSWKNQSIVGVANRLLRHVDYDEQFAAHEARYTNIADLSFATVNSIIAGTALLLGLIYITVMPRRALRTRETDALEFALFILLLLVVTPLAFGYLFASLLYPLTVVVHRLLVAPTRRLLTSAAFAGLLLAWTLPFQRQAQALGNTFFATLILFAGLALELWTLKRRLV
ncbi:MAG: glycosyltransferase family 87 protein [Chthoniobacterales bacterium]